MAGGEVVVGDVGAATRGDDEALLEATDDKTTVESLVVTTVGDTMAGGDAVVGHVSVATKVADPQMNCLRSRFGHMTTSRKLLVGNFRQDNNCANRRTVAHYERQAQRFMVRTPLLLHIIPNLTNIVTFLFCFYLSL